MKEAGDGLQQQMNCMMGALQELKLLQVQTALEQLEISNNQSQTQSHSQSQAPSIITQHQPSSNGRDQQEPKRSPGMGAKLERQGWKPRNIIGHSNTHLTNTGGPQTISEWLGEYFKQSSSREVQPLVTPPASQDYIIPPRDKLSPSEGDLGREPQARVPTSATRSFPVESGLRIRSTQGQEEDSNDWTSSLLSQSRTRQPLILGDNVFADLVGNWLDLPEMEKRHPSSSQQGGGGGGGVGGRAGQANTVPALSRSQDLQKKLSLTTNIFKKLLRSVRSDKDKLLKDKPGEEGGTVITKRSKKASVPKMTFYFALRGGSAQPGRGAEILGCGRTSGPDQKLQPIECADKLMAPIDVKRSSFDYSTVVWV
eukprot:gi/632962997/ref/XP_007897636.1/ PREDICTED: protein FAM212B isoform X2 [Callorhinchus milii]